MAIWKPLEWVKTSHGQETRWQEEQFQEEVKLQEGQRSLHYPATRGGTELAGRLQGPITFLQHQEIISSTRSTY